MKRVVSRRFGSRYDRDKRPSTRSLRDRPGYRVLALMAATSGCSVMAARSPRSHDRCGMQSASTMASQSPVADSTARFFNSYYDSASIYRIVMLGIIRHTSFGI